jgi:hypothetical protein
MFYLVYLVVVLTPINVFSSIGGGAMSASRVVAKGMYVEVGCMVVDIKLNIFTNKGCLTSYDSFGMWRVVEWFGRSWLI